jgi:hypothetical protein
LSTDTISGNWQLLAYRVKPSELAFFNITKTVTTPSFSLGNKEWLNTFIAKSNWVADAYSNMDLAEFICYDKALSDTEIGYVRDYLMNKYPITPTLTSTTWTSLFSKSRPTGTFEIIESHPSPNTQWQLNSTDFFNNINIGYRSYPLKNTSGFVCNFELYVKGDADTLFFFAGSSNINVAEGGFGTTGGYFVTFNIWNTDTITLNYNGANLASASFATNVSWEPVEIVYNNSTSNTWNISWNGSNVISYSDPLNNSRTPPGNFWGIGSRTGGAAANFYIRRVNFYHTGFLDSLPPVQSGLVGYYTGESMSGNTWTDLSGSGNNATTANVVNNAVTINGFKAASGGTNGTVCHQIQWC